MKIGFNFDGTNFLSGVIFALCASGYIPALWLVLAVMLIISIEVTGMPFATLTYKTGEGWKFERGFYR